MRKLFFTVIAIVAAVTFANGQLYIGGSVGLNTTGGSAKAFDGTEMTGSKTFGFEIAPRIGYYFNDDFSFGAALSINNFKVTAAGDNPEWQSTTMFGITPYMRYAFLTVGKFKVNLEAGVGLGFGSVKVKDQPSNVKNSIMNFNIYAMPVLTYDLTNNITLETSLNFCELYYTSSTFKQKAGDDNEASESVNGFGIGVNTNNVIRTGTSIDFENESADSSIITIGFTYKF